MLGYQQSLDLGPPDFSWLTKSHTPPPILTNFLGIRSDCPLGIASAPQMGNERFAMTMLDLGYGQSTAKTRRGNPTGPWDPPLVGVALERPNLMDYDPQAPPELLVSFKLSEVAGHVPDLVNSIGVPSEEPGPWQEIFQRIRQHPNGRFVILSVMGDGESSGNILSDFRDAIRSAKAARPGVIELNVSCPNRESKLGDVQEDPELVERICKEAVEELEGSGIKLILNSYVPSVRMLDLVKRAGPKIDAISFRKTIKVRHKVKPRWQEGTGVPRSHIRGAFRSLHLRLDSSRSEGVGEHQEGLN